MLHITYPNTKHVRHARNLDIQGVRRAGESLGPLGTGEWPHVSPPKPHATPATRKGGIMRGFSRTSAGHGAGGDKTLVSGAHLVNGPQGPFLW